MAPKKTVTAAEGSDGAVSKNQLVANVFTTRDQEILLNAFIAFKEFPTVDYEKLAELCGMSNPRSASNAWALLRKKIASFHEANGDAAPVMMGPPATPSKRKAGDTGSDDTENGGSAESSVVKKTPAKRARATPKKKAVAGSSTDANGDVDMDGIIPATPTKTPRKRAPKKTAAAAAASTKSDAVAIDSDSEAETIVVKKENKAAMDVTTATADMKSGGITVPVVKKEVKTGGLLKALIEGDAAEVDGQSESGFSGIDVIHPDDEDYEERVKNGVHYTGQDFGSGSVV